MASDINPARLAAIEDRLETCFEAVFTGLTSEQIRNAEQDQVEDWDSLAALQLTTLIEEEFEIELDFEDAVELETFQAIAEFLARLQ